MPVDSTTASLALLRESIEALALDVALRDLSSSEQIEQLSPALTAIRQHAESAGMIAVAEAARVPPSTEAAWRDLVSHMQLLIAAAESPAASGQPAPLALNQDPELIADFILESREHLSGVEIQLLALERDPRNKEAINAIFRGFHTIKGLAGFLDFPAIQRFAHEVETLLDLARNQKLPVDSTLIDIILQSADHMKQCLGGIEAGSESTSGAEPLIARIQSAGRALSPVHSADSLAQLAMAIAQPPPSSTPETANQEPASAPRSVKVDTAKLDSLVDMVGELVIAQSMIRHDPDMASLHSARLTRNLAQLTRITSDVQRVAMSMRMHPVGQLFQRMARLVRDLSRKSFKQVNLELSGEETELDRNMVEELADPLMHMVRNAVDHGAEPPDERIAAGKDPSARLELKAFHQGGFINIGISDDGRGLLRDKILRKARERGLVANGDQLSDQDVFSFIFEPGFSTAEQVTNVSGRGVGMDVARRQIAKLRGRIEIASVPGRGTTFTLKLPLTLAIIEGLVTGVGDQRYIIPIFAVKEMFRPAQEALSSVPDGGEMVLVRGALLPILRLHSRFGIEPRSVDAARGVLVVVESTQRNYCVLVDDLIGKQEVVIKSLGETFRNVPGIAGGSILGDGRVGLILDVEALFGSPSHQ
ncbi:MAG: chemotaxis protein CheA [Bryobacteraceae bacterium]|jgi:two-component system chemotaxis sensor kinase CheA